MAIRNDLTINWEVSPRIITVDSPSVEITCQDLHDTLRNEEAQPGNIDNRTIVESAGLEALGGGTSVGLTVTLLNALVAFEDRLGPSYEQCRVNGGNLVALQSDLSTYFDTPISPTAFTQVVTTASSSATTQNQASIEYASFEGGTWVDSVNGALGTDGLKGNAQNPVKLIADAVAICIARGLPKVIYVIGDLTPEDYDDIQNFHLIGTSHINSILVINDLVECLNTRFSKFDITGTLDGNSEIRDCVVRDMEYFNGHIHNSYLAGYIRLRGSEQANISNCEMIENTDTPVIDLGGSGQDLAMTNWTGLVQLTNLTGASFVGIGMDAGAVIIDGTCTSGEISVSGTGKTIDYSSNTCYVIDTAIDGTEINNLQHLIENQRPHHTGYGKVLYWDPYAGNDIYDGLHPRRATKTFAQAHVLAEDNAHDIIIAISGDPSGNTVSTENISITKNYTFLRGPGRDFRLSSIVDSVPAVNITGNGVEVSGFVVSTELTNTTASIVSTGKFPLLENLFLEESVNGIHISDGEFGVINNCRIGHNTGFGITFDGNSKHTKITNSHIGTNGNNGVIIDLTTGHEVTFEDTVIHGNTGYGVDISATSTGVQILQSTTIFDNSVASVNDLGTNTIDKHSNTIDYAKALYMGQERKVWVDTTAVENGDGAQGTPFNNLGDTLDFAEDQNIYTIVVLADIIIDRNLKNFKLIGVGTPEVDANDKDLKNSEFHRVRFKGDYTESIIIQESVLLEGAYLNGFFENCVIAGNLICKDGGAVSLKDCASAIDSPSVSLNGPGFSTLNVTGYYGGLTITDCNSALDKVTIGIARGALTFDASCVAGTITAYTDGSVVNNATASVTIEAYNKEIWQLLGLDPSNAMTVTPTAANVGDISQAITGDGETTTTVTRN